MKIVRTSIISGAVRTKEINVTQDQLDDYYIKGLLIQDAFPHLSADDREFIMTGIIQDEWNEMVEDEA